MPAVVRSTPGKASEIFGIKRRASLSVGAMRRFPKKESVAGHVSPASSGTDETILGSFDEAAVNWLYANAVCSVITNVTV